ncbi:MAG: hypothetical protein AB7S26_14200 [Sandaracinaceae bacterium]
MNFVGHAAVAWTSRPDPRFALGAMLPDFASMGGAKLEGADEPVVGAGIEHHHRVDRAFHDLPRFRDLCHAGTRSLEELGLGAGPAAAVAHVGIELLLDGHLLDRPDATLGYRAAIALSDDFGIRVRRGSSEAIHEVRRRLRQIGIPRDYRSTERVAVRLRQILARRPRLALAEGDEARMAPWLEATQAALAPEVDGWLTEIAVAAR